MAPREVCHSISKWLVPMSSSSNNNSDNNNEPRERAGTHAAQKALRPPHTFRGMGRGGSPKGRKPAPPRILPRFFALSRPARDRAGRAMRASHCGLCLFAVQIYCIGEAHNDRTRFCGAACGSLLLAVA